jgi:hypothetical protein
MVGDLAIKLLPDSIYRMNNPICFRNLNTCTKFSTCGFDQTIKIKIKFLIKWMKIKLQ